MGQGGDIKIYNATPFDLKQTSNHTYQMDHWDVPSTIKANTASEFYVEFCEHIFKNAGDDGADTYYDLNSTKQTFHLMARAGYNDAGMLYFDLKYQSGWSDESSEPLTSPFYMFWSTSDSTWRLLNNNAHDIGWHWNKDDDSPVVVKIVQINQYCDTESEAMDIVTDLENDNQSSQQFQDFVNTVNHSMSGW